MAPRRYSGIRSPHAISSIPQHEARSGRVRSRDAHMRSLRRRRILIALVVVFGMLAVLAGAALAWALTPLPADSEARGALRSDEVVAVSRTDSGYEFRTADETPTVGLIFYPGGRVEAEAYAPLAREVAELGYLVTIVEMRLDLAVLSPDRADEVIAGHPEVVTWTIGGHSLGGAMAARYADMNPDTIRGLVLLASYPPKSTDLRDQEIRVTSVFGSSDGVLDPEDFEDATDRLPADTNYIRLEGGNHAQFGSYGPQSGDNPARMSAEDQRWHAVNAIAETLLPLRIRSGG